MDWYTLEQRFREIQDPHGDLAIQWSETIYADDSRPNLETWHLVGGADSNSRRSFEALARLASAMLPGGSSSAERWFRELSHRGIGRDLIPRPTLHQFDEERNETAVTHCGMILRAIESSVTLCRELEAESLRAAPEIEPEEPVKKRPGARKYTPSLLGDALRRSRKRDGKTQGELAVILNVEGGANTVSRWERGIYEPSPQNVGDVEEYIRTHHPDGQAALDQAREKLGEH